MDYKNLATQVAKNLFTSTRRALTLDYLLLKQPSKEPEPSIRDWIRFLFLRKRAWEYRGYGLIALLGFSLLALIYWKAFQSVIPGAWELDIALGLIFISVFAIVGLVGLVWLMPIFIWPKIILRVLFGDINPRDVARSISDGDWKEAYNSKYESVLAFLVYDPIGRLAGDVPYGDNYITYSGYYSEPLPPNFSENVWMTSQSDQHLQWRIRIGKDYYLVEYRYLPDGKEPQEQEK